MSGTPVSSSIKPAGADSSTVSLSVQPLALIDKQGQQQQNPTESEGVDSTERLQREQGRLAREREEVVAIQARRERQRERVRAEKWDDPPVGENTVNRGSDNNNIVNENVDSATRDEDVNMVTTGLTQNNQTYNKMG